MILQGFTQPEIHFLDSVIGCAVDNEGDKDPYEALAEAANELLAAWEFHQELAIWTLAHHHILWNYATAIYESLVDTDDYPPECTVERRGEWYWSEAAYGKLLKMLSEMNDKILTTAACYYFTLEHHGEIDDPS